MKMEKIQILVYYKWHWLAYAFALFGSLAGFGIANTVQSVRRAPAR